MLCENWSFWSRYISIILTIELNVPVLQLLMYSFSILGINQSLGVQVSWNSAVCKLKTTLMETNDMLQYLRNIQCLILSGKVLLKVFWIYRKPLNISPTEYKPPPMYKPTNLLTLTIPNNYKPTRIQYKPTQI